MPSPVPACRHTSDLSRDELIIYYSLRFITPCVEYQSLIFKVFFKGYMAFLSGDIRSTTHAHSGVNNVPLCTCVSALPHFQSPYCYYFSMRHLIRLRTRLGVGTKNRVANAMQVMFLFHVQNLDLALCFRGKLLHRVAYWDIGLCGLGLTRHMVFHLKG